MGRGAGEECGDLSSGFPVMPGSLLLGVAGNRGVCLLSGKFALFFTGCPAKCHPWQGCHRSC